jgi:FkbM family methyltransferase
MIHLPRPLGTLKFLGAWLVPWRPAFCVRAAGSDLAFFVHHRDTIGRHIAKYGTHEPLVTRWMAEFLNAAPRGIAIDIGANLGWHAVHAARHPNVETLVAFEPDPFNAWLLERNLSQNGIENVIVENRAVGATPGAAKLHRYKGANYGRHSIAADHGYGSRTVPVTDLDGALAALDFAVVEYSPDLSRAGGLSTDDMMQRLQSAGFAPFVLLPDGGTTRTDAGELARLAGSTDVIWVKTARLTALARGMNERGRGSMSLLDIAEANKRVVKPV